MKSVTAKYARQNFSEVLNEVHFGRKKILITRSGKPLVVLVSVKDLNLKRKTEDNLWDEFKSVRIMINAVEQGLPRAAAEQYIKSPRKYHGGEYLGRDLAVRETVNPVRLFIGGYIAFFVLREYSTATGDDVGRILAAIVFGAAPFFTEKFIFRRRPDIMANNYPA